MKLIDASRRYYKGNTHAHTTRSDGTQSPEAVMRMFKDAGYDFLVLSDHWTPGPTEEFEGMLVLTGAEYDFNFPEQVLHIVGVFPDEDAAQGFHHRMDYPEVIGRINAQGGAAIFCHPAWSLNTPEMIKSVQGVCAVEVYNSFSGAPWNAPRADSGAVLDLVATAGRCIPQVAADDCHFYTGEQLMSYIMLQADELTSEGVIAALKRGSFYASQGPQFIDAELTERELIVRTSPVNRCTFISNLVYVEGRCRTGEGMVENVYRLQPGETFIRCEIEDDRGRRAWLSPVRL